MSCGVKKGRYNDGTALKKKGRRFPFRATGCKMQNIAYSSVRKKQSDAADFLFLKD